LATVAVPRCAGCGPVSCAPGMRIDQDAAVDYHGAGRLPSARMIARCGVAENPVFSMTEIEQLRCSKHGGPGPPELASAVKYIILFSNQQVRSRRIPDEAVPFHALRSRSQAELGG
jgi:hypothetical protein